MAKLVHIEVTFTGRAIIPLDDETARRVVEGGEYTLIAQAANLGVKMTFTDVDIKTAEYTATRVIPDTDQ